MTDKYFPILGETIPPMIGRTDIMRRLLSDLTKTTPSHLSIVGPRFSGKTIVMNGLAERMRQENSPYHSVIYWDLGHQTPVSNDDFFKTLCRKIGEGLKSAGNEYGDHLLHVENEEYSELRDVLEFLHDDGIKVLMLWDGFDKPLGSGKLTRNLWDQLRELASNPSLRLVTATRRPLHELLRSEDAVTSDFWNIFDMTPVKVGVFDENDRSLVLENLSCFKLKSGAMSELENWSTGFPPLFLALLNQIMKSGATDEIDHLTVNEAARAVMVDVESVLTRMWDDCPEPAKDIYRHLVNHGEMTASDAGNSNLNCLKEKGFVKISGSKAIKGCRLLEQFIKNRGDDGGSMVRLFGIWEDYRSNIRSLLEHRLGQLTTLDTNLRRYIERSIEDIPGHPEVCLSNMRGIVDRVLDLIWAAELGPEKSIPDEWFTEWQYNGEKGAECYWNKQFPAKRGHQVRLLQLMTGTQNSAPKARRISKNTWVLANAAHGFGDFGQHIDGLEIPVGVAISAVNVCLELAACLNTELGKR